MNPRFSVIVPVFNECLGINNLIDHLQDLADKSGRSIEMIVADGDPEKKTLAAIRHREVITLACKKGRGSQMNAGAARACGDILLFLHADTRLPDDGLTLIDRACGHPAHGAGAFDLAIDSTRIVFRLIEKLASRRSRLTRIPYGDQAFFFAAGYFRQLGGFADLPLMEDVEMMRRIKKRGGRIVLIDRPVQTSARRWEKEGILRCTLRNWCLISLYLLGADPQRLAGFYRVHTEKKVMCR